MKKFSFMFLFIIFTFAVISLTHNNSYAQQSSFQVSAPPIPWFEFTKGQKDLKVNGTFIYMTGEIDDPEVGGNVEVAGGGASGFYRYAFRNNFAFDVGGLALGASGYIGDVAEMSFGIFSIPFDLEIQPVNTEKYSIILFAGFNFTWFLLGLEADDGHDQATIEISSTMRGPQGGIQAAIKFPEFVFTPFFMITSMSGNASIDYEDSNGTNQSLSSGIGASKAYYYGIDIIYKPWDITLSSVIQQAMSSGGNQPYKTYVVMLSYHFELEKGENTIEMPPVEENKTPAKSKRKQADKQQNQ